MSRRKALAGIGGGAAMAAAMSMLGMTTAIAAQSDSGTPESGGNGNYLVIRRYELAEGVDAEAATQQIQNEFVPIVREVPGFVAYYYLTDLEAGTAASISVFTSEAGSDESTERAASWVAEHFQGVYAGPPEVLAGTLGISEEAS